MICPESGYPYEMVPFNFNSQLSAFSFENSVLRCLDADENAPLPAELAKGTKSYDEFKHSG